MADIVVLGKHNAPSVMSNISQSIADVATTAAVDIIAAGTAGQQVQILEYMLITDTATTYTFTDESSNLDYPVIMVAKGGLMRQSATPKLPLMVGTVGEKVTVTANTSATVAKLLTLWRYVDAI